MSAYRSDWLSPNCWMTPRRFIAAQRPSEMPLVKAQPSGCAVLWPSQRKAAEGCANDLSHPSHPQSEGVPLDGYCLLHPCGTNTCTDAPTHSCMHGVLVSAKFHLRRAEADAVLCHHEPGWARQSCRFTFPLATKLMSEVGGSASTPCW